MSSLPIVVQVALLIGAVIVTIAAGNISPPNKSAADSA